MSTNTPSPAPRVTLLPSGKQFDAAPHRSLLDAGLSAGLALPFGCANGTCGDCRARVQHGEVKKHRHHDFTLTASEKVNGVCLMCSNTAVTDCQIEVMEATSVDDIPYQQLPARLCRLNSSDGTVIMAFKFSRGKALRFLPGQRVFLTYDDGFSINLPIASCPCNAHALEFHLTPDHAQPDLFAEMKNRVTTRSSRERIVISGPVGQFTLSKNVYAPKLFVVTGGEFGQAQGMIEQVFNLELQTPCCLIWRRSTQTGHYQHNLCRSWQDAFDEFHYLPINSSDDPVACLPEHWSTHLATTELYLGSANHPGNQAWIERGVQKNNVYYPVSSSD